MTKKTDSDGSLPTQRSWWSAYSPIVLLIVIIVFALFAVFSTATKPAVVSPPVPTPAISEKEYRDNRQAEILALIKNVSNRVKGDWNKVTPFEKEKINNISQGHGKEMIESDWAEAKLKKKTP
jgi:hypothetical protein